MFTWQQVFNMRQTIFLILLVFATKNIHSQVVGTPYIIQGENNKSFILDSISQLPTVAYSVRKVSKTYHGFCMRVRRSSDNSLIDVGFDDNGNLDVSYLLTFVGSSNGYVAIWYDQTNSGRHLTQVTQAYQPMIVQSGTVLTQNGKPFISFYAIPNTTTYNHMDVTGGSITTNAQVFIVNAFGTVSGSDGFLLGHTTYFCWHSDNGVKLFHSTFANASIRNGDLYINGVLSSTSTAPYHSALKLIALAPQTANSGTDWNVIGRDRNNHHTSNGGGYAEIMSFSNTILSSERLLIQSSTMSYFGL